MKTLIKKIVLDVGGKEVELTLEQAKTLFGALEEMFGAKTTVLPTPIYIERPNRWYWTYPQPYYQPVTIGNSGTAGSPYPPGTITMNSSASAYNPTTAQMQDNGTLRLTC